jgi:sugar phosphate isomerase/epimerase
MTCSIRRRELLMGTGAMAGAVALGGPSGAFLLGAEAVTLSTPAAEKLGWRLSCASYTFRAVSLYEAIEKIASLGVRLVEPAFFLRLKKGNAKLKPNESLPPKIRKELKKNLADRGMAMANYYAKLGADEAACRKTFDFAKEMGVETLVSEPPAEAFDMIEKLCEEYKINLAVHNHPKKPGSNYWHPDKVLAVCKGRGKRIGACCDTGHWVRSGLNCVECLQKMKGRILTMHLKDVLDSGNPKARDVVLGTGKANYAAVLKELHGQGFRGVMSIEYEHQSPKLMEEVAACLKFVEDAAKTL